MDGIISNRNYLVKYSIPSIFKLKKYDTSSGWYGINNLQSGNSLNLNAIILNRNIYEYLDKENMSSIYENTQYRTYSKFEEKLDRFKEEKLSYIYRCAYEYADVTASTTNEEIRIVFELNKNHILVIEIEAHSIGIPEELVDMIELKESKNVASNLILEKEDKNLIGKLKRFKSYGSEITEEITLKLPEECEETDYYYDYNLYTNRRYKFGKTYKIEYETTNISEENIIETSNYYLSENEKYEKLTKVDDIVSNDRRFTVYNGWYVEKDFDEVETLKNEMILLYQLEEEYNYNLKITITAEDKITEEVIAQFTNFEINLV